MPANKTDEVTTFMGSVGHPLGDVIEEIRDAILRSNDQITERIKWNAPSFCYDGDDRVTFKLHPQNSIQLVFHRGARVRSDSEEFKFVDETGLLRWRSSDRAIVTFKTPDDARTNREALVRLVNLWMESTSER